MNTTKPFKKFFTDKNGNSTITQKPNLPIFGWIVFMLLSWFIESKALKTGTEQLSTAFLFLWAYLEITKGDSLFRRVLGGVVMFWIVVGFFK